MKKNQKLIAAACALITTLTLAGCSSSSPGKTKEAFNVNTVKFTDYSKDISADEIYNTIKQFSSTDNARIAGFEGEQTTSEFIKKEFEKLGFEVKEQSFPVKAFKCEGTEVKLLSDGNKVIDSHFLTYSKNTPKEGITADIVSGGMGTDSELDSANIKDKLVLIKRGGEPFRIKAERAYGKGALGAIFYDPTQEKLIAATLIQPSNIPAVTIIKSEGEKIAAMLTSGKSVKVTLKVDSLTTDGTSKNIIGTMKAKNETSGKSLVVGAHYDGVDTPAANDNASGIATVLQVAKVLSKEKFDCDIKFIAFGAEEVGLVGSNFYVNSLTSKEIGNTLGMINLDMVGTGDTLTIHTLQESSKSLPADLAVNCVTNFNYKHVRTAMDSSDHVAFETNGIPVAYMEYGPFEDYHTDKDTIEVINKDNLLHVCNVVVNMCRIIGKNVEAFSQP